MLDFMRKNANSWVMILLFAIIIFVFAINFGPWAGTSMTSVPYAVIVNDEPISMAEFRTAYGSQFARIKQFRPDYDQAQADKDGLKQMVLEHLISRELLTQLGHKYRLSIGPKTLAEEIKERVFGTEGEFNKEEYVKRIHNYFQTTVNQFEQQVAKEMVAEQMANILGTPVYVSEDEIKTSYKNRNTKLALDFIKVDPAYFKSDEAIPADKIKEFEQGNNEKISTYYNEHISSYVKPPEIRASHILIKAPQGANESEKIAQKAKAEAILERIKKGEDFATLAKAESEDVGSKPKGGDLDYFSEGMMVEEFSKAAFALKEGEVSSVVESPFGFHIIKKTGEKPKVERTLEDAKVEIAEILMRKEEQDKKAFDLAKAALEDLKKGVPLASISKGGIVHVKDGKLPENSKTPIASETEPFSESAPFVANIGRTASLGSKVFGLSKEHPTPPDVVEANGVFFAFRLKSKTDADMEKFAEQKNSIRMSLLFPRKRAIVQQYLTQMKNNAKLKYNPTLLAAAPVEP